MKNVLRHTLCATLLAGSAISNLPAYATGLATCDSGPQDKWQRQSTLEKKLAEIKWKVRRIKIDGGCYEVYAINDKGQRVEAYFHPVTLEPVPVGPQMGSRSY